jgi:hypothetical protein
VTNPYALGHHNFTENARFELENVSKDGCFVCCDNEVPRNQLSDSAVSGHANHKVAPRSSQSHVSAESRLSSRGERLCSCILVLTCASNNSLSGAAVQRSA